MRVLVTGHRGYFGGVLTTVLRNAHIEVVGLDCDLYHDCDFGGIRTETPSFDMDLREIEFADLLSFDAVIHLAALPEADARTVPASLMYDVNLEGTVRLADCCRKASVSRFLFASTCSVYGARGGQWLNEDSEPIPATSYAHSKRAAERALADLTDSTFHAVSLRNPTLYGVSPRMRVDLVVNDFVGAAVSTGRVAMRTLGNAWRPLVHVEDLARAYLAILTAPPDRFPRDVLNPVDAAANHRVIDVADAVVETIPNVTRGVPAMQPDARSYRVEGGRFRQAFPSFRFRWDLSRGIRQLRTAYENAGLTASEWRSDRYRREPRLARLAESRGIQALFQSTPAAASVA